MKKSLITGGREIRPGSKVVGDMTKIAVMTALMAVCSWITIPFTPPFTMQTFAVFFALLLLGGSRGTMAITLYVLLGAVGMPVFSGFSGGVGHLVGPTGGYIFGFILSGLIYRLLEHVKPKGEVLHLLLLLLCHCACYAAGTAWYALHSGVGFIPALMGCVLPFVVPDIIKIIMAVRLASKIEAYC